MLSLGSMGRYSKPGSQVWVRFQGVGTFSPTIGVPTGGDIMYLVWILLGLCVTPV